MPHRRELKGVLHNFLGTYTSRYSDHDGYWIFGLAEAQLSNLRVDLFGTPTPNSREPKALATELARRRFNEQLAKARIPRSFVREAQVTVDRSATRTSGFVNGRSVGGHIFTFSVRAVSDRGAVFEDKASVFVAPHNAKLERRRTRRFVTSVPAFGIIPVSLGVLLVALSFIDIAGRAAQRYLSVAVIVCCIALVLFALRRPASWIRVATIACAAVAVAVCILQIASL